MKVPLPSNGILGISQVDLRAPSFRDIRAINQMNQEPELLKAQFVISLLSEKIDLHRITKQDLDYLFIIAAFSTQLNRLSFNYQCSCGKPVKDEILLDNLEVEDLEKYSLPYKHSLNGKEYSYTLLSAQDHIDACEYALNHENFDEAYSDYAVYKILNLHMLSDVDNLPVQAYTSALLFQKANFHGVKTIKPVVCPHCSKLSHIHINVGPQVVQMDLTALMETYNAIKNSVDFQAFLDFTSAEYKAYMNVLEVEES